MRRPARRAPRPPRTHRYRKPARRENAAPDRVTPPAQPPAAARTPKQAVTEERLDAAERAVLDAQAEVKDRRNDVKSAREDAHSAAAALKDAERSVDEARARLGELTGA